MTPHYTFRCEGCGTRVTSATVPSRFSVHAMGCSLVCTLTAVEAQQRRFTEAVRRRQFDPTWLAMMAQAGMRPSQWLKLTQRELHDDVVRLRDLVHREQLARDDPEAAQVRAQVDASLAARAPSWPDPDEDPP